MYILSQNGDVIFPLSDKGLLRGTVYTEDIYINGKFYGSNIYGKNITKTYLLGTYEEDEAAQVISEIYALLKAGARFYSMPAPTFDLEDLGVSI